MINRKNLWKKTISLLCAIAICVSAILAGVPAKAAVGSTEPSLPSDYTELHWTDFEGLNYQEYINPSPDGAKGTYSKSLNKTLLSGELVMGANTDLRYAGTGWSGLLLCADMWGNLVIESSTFATKYEKVLAAADYGLTSFAGNQFNLKISTKIDGSKYTFGIWVNDKYVDTLTLEANEGTAAGSVLGLYGRGSGNITLVETQPDVPPTEEVPTDYTELHWTDFEGLNYQEYINPSPDGAKGTYSKSLNKTLLSGELVMGANTDLRYAGTGWSGLLLCADMWGNLVIESSTFATKYEKVLAAADYGLTSFAGNQFNLKISTKIDGSKYTFGIWVNDKYVDTLTLEANEGTAAGSALGLYGRGSGNITLVETQPDVPPTEEVPTDYTELHWTDFEGLNYQEYINPSPDGAKGTYSKSLNKTLLSGELVMGANTDLRYAGTGWSGLLLCADMWGNLVIDSSTFATKYEKVLAAADYGLTSFAGNQFNLKISTKIDGSKYTFGIWVNDKYVDTFTLEANEGTAAGSALGLYGRGSGNITLVKTQPDVPPTEPIQPPTDFTVITLDDFGGTIRSGTLTSGDVIVGELTTVSSYDRTIFNVNVNMVTDSPGDATYIRFGGTSDGWVGIGFESRPNGSIELWDWQHGSVLQVYTKDKAGVDFFKKDFNLKISFEFIDSDNDGNKDDLRLGVYFNNVLYNNELVVARDFEMTKFLLARTDDAERHPLKLEVVRDDNEVAIRPDKSLKEISFSSFGIEDAVFDNIDVSRLCATGSYYDIEEGNTLDGTLFHGEVKFSKVGSCEFRFGGLISPWTGIRIMGASDGNIYVLDAEGDAPEKQYSYILNPYDAGCQLVGKWLDLKISTQFVDGDDDGKKDDVQLGFWFNDVLYKNEYIILMDYRKNMGSYLSIYCFDANTDIAIKSVELNNTISLDIFGLDDNFKNQFASTGKDPVVGEPLGVTQEYETADYHLDMTREAMEVEKPGGDSTIHPSEKLRYVILATIGSVCLAGIIVWLILFVKKRKK